MILPDRWDFYFYIMKIDHIRTFCKTLPAVTEDMKWDNDLVFSVGSKMFCVAALEPPLSCSFKVADEEFEELCIHDGFLPAPYLARAKWILVTNSPKLNRVEWGNLSNSVMDLVKAKLTNKFKQQLGIIV